MEADVRWCPHCKQRGEKKRLRLLQINDSLATFLCENEKCVDLGEMSSVSNLILQRKSSEIPNTKKKKSRSAPVVSSMPKMHVNSSLPDSAPDGAVRMPYVTARNSALESSQVLSRESANLLAARVSLTALPCMTLWRNKSALCWLDACMCVLVACRSLRTCLVQLPEKSPIKRLCMRFVEAQKRPRSVPPVNAHCSPEVCKIGVSHRKSASGQDSAKPCPAVEDLFAPSVDSLTDNDRNRAAAESNACRVLAPNQTSESLDRIRDEVFQRLQPKMKCDVGQDNSPVLALPLLLRLDTSIEEHFMCRYRWEFYCTMCGLAEVNMNKKTLPTFTSVPTDFSMADPVMLNRCYRCGSENQKSHLVFHSLPACMMMHFEGGLPHGDLSRHHTFIVGGETYTLSAVVQYRRNPDHFVTLIRDQETNHWLEYDDILPSPYTWQSYPPSIPASEIHILVWERAETPCTACQQMHNDVSAIRDMPVRTAGSSIPGGNMEPVPPQTGLPHWNGNGIWRKSTFASPSVLRRGTDEQHVASRSNRGRNVSYKTSVAVEAINKSEEQGSVIDLTTETVCDLTGDTSPEEDNDSNTASGLDPVNLDKDNAQGTQTFSRSRLVSHSRLSGFSQNRGAEKPNFSQQDRGVTVKKIEQDQQPKKLKTQRNTAAKTEPQPQMTELTFLSKIRSRRKIKNTNEPTGAKSAMSTILGTIPEQLLKFCRNGDMASHPRTERAPLHQERASTNSTILSKIPKQLISGRVNPRMSVSQILVEQSRSVARPILAGSSCKVPAKLVKFQPYGRSLDSKTTQQGQKEILSVRPGTRSNISTLSSWQKRVGMYSSGAAIPRKRTRQDSAEDSYQDLPKHLGPPCSSVSSPSACSDISSVSDNQSFASSKDDLTATIDELCKVLDIGSEYTPSVSSRFSSPSQDMFFSEIFPGGTAWVGPEDKDNYNGRSENIGRLETSHGNHTPVTLTLDAFPSMSVTSTLPSQSTSLVQADCPNDVVAPSVESLQPAAALEGTLPSVVELLPAVVPVGSTVPSAQPVMIHSTMLPSCVTLQPAVVPVAMQQPNPIQPGRDIDHMIRAHGGNTTVHSEIVEDLDDITDPRLFEDIQDSLAVMETDEWNENFMEFLAQ